MTVNILNTITNFHITPIFLSITLESQILIVFNMFNVTGKSQKVRYEYHFLNVRQVTRYTCRKFVISHGGAHVEALRTFWCILMLKYRNIVFQSENSVLEGMNSYSAPPHAPPMSCHEFFTYFMLYLSYIEKIILISHFLAAIGHIERNKQKSSIFDISAKFSSLPWSSQTLKMAENGMGVHFYTYKHEY